jgi:hypothetical protein
MSSVLGKRPAEGSLDNEPEAKQARTEPMVCLHRYPNIELVYESKPGDEQKIKEKVEANKTILAIHFGLFDEYFKLYPNSINYEFQGSYEEWTLFIRMLKDTSDLIHGRNHIIINIIDLDKNMLKMYEKFQLTSSIIIQIIRNSINRQLTITKTEFWPTDLISLSSNYCPNIVYTKPCLSDSKLQELKQQLKYLYDIINIYKEWNAAFICMSIGKIVEIALSKIMNMLNSKELFKELLKDMDRNIESIFGSVIAKLLLQ